MKISFFHTLLTTLMTMMAIAAVQAGHNYMTMSGGFSLHPILAGAAALFLVATPLALSLMTWGDPEPEPIDLGAENRSSAQPYTYGAGKEEEDA